MHKRAVLSTYVPLLTVHFDVVGAASWFMPNIHTTRPSFRLCSPLLPLARWWVGPCLHYTCSMHLYLAAAVCAGGSIVLNDKGHSLYAPVLGTFLCMYLVRSMVSAGCCVLRSVCAPLCVPSPHQPHQAVRKFASTHTLAGWSYSIGFHP